MARPSNADKLRRYQQQIRRSMEWRETDGYDELWRRMVDLYRGKHYDSLSPDDRLIINAAFATKNVIAPSVAVNNPKFTVNARKPEHADQAVVTEEVLNYVWRTGKYQTEFRLAVDDFLICGHGWMKVGYKFVKPPKYADTKSEPDGQTSTVEDCGIDDREPIEGNSESESNVEDDRPYVDRVSMHDMFVDPDATKMRELRWIAQRVRRPVADIHVDSRYEASARKKVKASQRDRYSRTEKPNNEETISDDGSGFADVYEFYDLRARTVCTFTLCAKEGDFLIKSRPIPYGFGHPFVMLRNYDVPDFFYPIGELEMIEGLQMELNETRTQMLNHRKKFARKYLYDASVEDERLLNGLRSDNDNELIPVSNLQHGELDKVVVPLQQVGTPADFYNQSDMIQGDIQYTAAVTDYMNGQTPNIRRTATEAAMMQDAQNSRSQDKLSKVEGCLSELGERIVKLLQQYMKGDQVIRVVGMAAAPVWIVYDKDYIAGDFDFEVEGGSTQPRNESFRRQSALQLVDAMAPFIGQGVVDPGAVVRHVLQYGFGVKDPGRFLMGGGQLPPELAGLGGEEAPMPGEPPMQPQGQPPVEAPVDSQVAGIPDALVNQLEGFTPTSALAA